MQNFVSLIYVYMQIQLMRIRVLGRKFNKIIDSTNCHILIIDVITVERRKTAFIFSTIYLSYGTTVVYLDIRAICTFRTSNCMNLRMSNVINHDLYTHLRISENI